MAMTAWSAEGLEQGDLLVGEWAHLGAPKIDRPHCRTFPKQGNGQRSPEPEFPSQGVAHGELHYLGLEISDVNGAQFQHGTPRDRPPHDRNRTAHGGGNWPVVRGHFQPSPVQLVKLSVVGPAKARGALDHRVQHWLHVCG